MRKIEKLWNGGCRDSAPLHSSAFCDRTPTPTKFAEQSELGRGVSSWYAGLAYAFVHQKL
jgi:hypothetical protein